MEEGAARSRAQRHTGRRTTAPAERRPDRIAMWAVFLGLFAAIAAAASAQGASSGGVGDLPVPPATGECPAIEFGHRPLQLGDCGTDVATLNLLLKSQPVGAALLADDQFSTTTADVAAGLRAERRAEHQRRRRRQRPQGAQEGDDEDRRELVRPRLLRQRDVMRRYPLTKDTIGVAHRKLPCGTKLDRLRPRPLGQRRGDRPRPVRQGGPVGPDAGARARSSASSPPRRSLTRSP